MVRSGASYPIWTPSISIYNWTAVVSVRSFVIISYRCIMSSVRSIENYRILNVWNTVIRIPNARRIITVDAIHITNTV